MLQPDFTTLSNRWGKRFRNFFNPPIDPPSLSLPLHRPNLAQLAAMDEEDLPPLVRQSPIAIRYLHLLGDLDWDHFPERNPHRAWPGPTPAPRAPYVAAYLVKIEEGKTYMSDLRTFLVEHPPLVWLLGFPLVPSHDNVWGFDAEASVPSRKQLGRVLRTLYPGQTQFLLKWSVRLLKEEFSDEEDLGNADFGEKDFGEESSLDTKHIIAWVRENNLKERIHDRYVKGNQPKGDPDCKLGFKSMGNQKRSKRQQKDGEQVEKEPKRASASAAATVTPPISPGNATKTPAKDGIPASDKKDKKGQYYWGYASGVVATKIDGWGEFVLAEITQTFDKSDPSYFYPLMEQAEENLGYKIKFCALDAAFDSFFVHEYCHNAGGFAAVPWADREDHRKTFDEQGLPLCAAGLAMPLKSTYFRRKNCLVPHQCARYACPLSFAAAQDDDQPQACPIDHVNWDKQNGCITTLPTSIGVQIRHELDRESDEYKDLYRQRTATERINSQAVALGIERPKLRNEQAIANQNTLIYVLINLHALVRVRKQKRALADQPC